MLWVEAQSATQQHCTGKRWEERALGMCGESWRDRTQQPSLKCGQNAEEGLWRCCTETCIQAPTLLQASSAEL